MNAVLTHLEQLQYLGFTVIILVIIIILMAEITYTYKHTHIDYA